MTETLPSAALATHAHDRVSHRYSFIPTTSVVDALQQDGWKVHNGSQKRVRDVSREGFQTHLLRFVRSDVQNVGDLKDQFSLIGRFSHDTSSSIQLMAGVIVFACSNGVIVSEGEIGTLRFIHRNVDLEEVIQGARNLVGKIPQLEGRIQRWKEIQLSPQGEFEFARAAAVARWGSPRIPGSEEPAERVILQARRVEDQTNSLWHTFNRVQENLVKGTDYGTYARRRGRRRWVSRRTRSVSGVDQSIDINQTLWDLGLRVEQGLPLLRLNEASELVLAN